MRNPLLFLLFFHPNTFLVYFKIFGKEKTLGGSSFILTSHQIVFLRILLACSLPYTVICRSGELFSFRTLFYFVCIKNIPCNSLSLTHLLLQSVSFVPSHTPPFRFNTYSNCILL